MFSTTFQASQVRFLLSLADMIYMPLGRVIALIAVLFSCSILAPTARGEGADAEYIGGTEPGIEGKSGRIITTDDIFLEFRSKGKQVHVGYDKINLLEYGQNVGRRVVMAAVLSPLFLLSKKRQHFLTVGFSDAQGKQQALVFKVDKKKIRSVLVALEARTGLKVQFQDQEARKAGKG
jgi:hypothetical protein